MPAKEQDAIKSDISPVLFISVDGEPMSFFLRPGPVKAKLQPLITAGGGILCKVQQPGAILLIDPEERGSIPTSAAHWYVSTQFIHDCIERDVQLNLEDYRLNPEVLPRHSARLNSNRESSPKLSGGRVAYTSEDDAAILSYISKHEAKVGGNQLWQEMEKQRVTGHSWQSMKYRYIVRLAKKQSVVVEAAATEEATKASEAETKVESDQEMDVEKPPCAEDVSPQSTESDLTQIDVQSMPAESAQAETTETQTSISPEGEVHPGNSEPEKQPAGGEQVEAVEETSGSPRREDTCVVPPTDPLAVSAESTDPETDEPQTSPRKESAPEDSEPSDASPQKKTKERQKASAQQEQPSRRLTRRQLLLEEAARGKNLRSSSSPHKRLLSSSQSPKKTKSATSALQEDSTVYHPPSKKARGRSKAAAAAAAAAAAVEAESREEDAGQAAASEATPADAESIPAPQRGEKKKEKRKLGILELATKEFEDGSEVRHKAERAGQNNELHVSEETPTQSEEDESPDGQNPTETRPAAQPAVSEPPGHASGSAAPTQSYSQPGPGLQHTVGEARAPASSCHPEPAATEAGTAASKAHLFIFESESQEEESQSIVGPADRQPAVSDAFSLTQAQLEEDKQRVRELIEQANQDLVSVTKALLMTSGDFAAALELLSNPSSAPGPFWRRCDDELLLSGDPAVRQQLQEKFSEEEVAKRIVFLEVEG